VSRRNRKRREGALPSERPLEDETKLDDPNAPLVIGSSEFPKPEGAIPYELVVCPECALFRIVPTPCAACDGVRYVRMDPERCKVYPPLEAPRAPASGKGDAS